MTLGFAYLRISWLPGVLFCRLHHSYVVLHRMAVDFSLTTAEQTTSFGSSSPVRGTDAIFSGGTLFAVSSPQIVVGFSFCVSFGTKQSPIVSNGRGLVYLVEPNPPLRRIRCDFDLDLPC